MLQLDRQASIEDHLRPWFAQQPGVVWLPSSEVNLQKSRVGPHIWSPFGGAGIARGGMTPPYAYGTTRQIKTNSTFGVTLAAPQHHGLLLVSSENPTSERGALFKLGDSTGGYGICIGTGNESVLGSQVILLKEGYSFIPSGSNALVAGLNIISFGFTNEGPSVYAVVHPTLIEAGSNNAYITEFANESYINGRTDIVSATLKVHGLFLWPGLSLNNSATVAWRNARVAEVSHLLRMPRQGVDRLFAPKRVYVGGAAGPLTISGLSTINVTTTTARPRMTVTY